MARMITPYLYYELGSPTTLSVPEIVRNLHNGVSTTVGSLDLVTLVLKELGFSQTELVDRIHFALYGANNVAALAF